MMMTTYPVTLTPDKEDGGFVVTCHDLPKAITQGDTIEECLSEAADCLDEAIAGRVDDKVDIPAPRRLSENREPTAEKLDLARFLHYFR